MTTPKPEQLGKRHHHSTLGGPGRDRTSRVPVPHFTVATRSSRVTYVSQTHSLYDMSSSLQSNILFSFWRRSQTTNHSVCLQETHLKGFTLCCKVVYVFPIPTMWASRRTRAILVAGVFGLVLFQKAQFRRMKLFKRAASTHKTGAHRHWRHLQMHRICSSLS